MLKIILTLVLVFFGIYGVGERARKNPKIDAFLSYLEGEYSKINTHLENSTVLDGVNLIKKMYGWISVILGLLLVAAPRLVQANQPTMLVIIWSFSFAFMGWFSIKWTLEHKRTVVDFARKNILLVFGPLLMGIFDTLLGTQFVDILIHPLYKIASALGLEARQFTNPLVGGSVISLVILAAFAVNYLFTWVITVPLFLLSLLVALVPIQIARFLAAIDRENTFFWLAAFAMTVASVWLALM